MDTDSVVITRNQLRYLLLKALDDTIQERVCRLSTVLTSWWAYDLWIDVTQELMDLANNIDAMVGEEFELRRVHYEQDNP